MGIKPTQKQVVLLAGLLTGLSLALYLGLAVYQLGAYTLTLDDAWIHQTYARNLARGEWFTYTGGQASSGSTSPAWTTLLAVGHRLGLDPVHWALALGALCHILAAALVYRLSLAYFGRPGLAAWAAGLTALEWRLVWIALSGMETTLFVALSLLYLYLIEAHWRRGWLLGLAGGFLFLTRPEGALLVAVAGLKLLWVYRRQWRQAAGPLLSMGLLFLLLVGPLLVFNTAISGRPLPGTFYAKFVQWVAPWTVAKGLNYFGLLLRYFWLEGSLFLLFPLALFAGWLAWRRRLARLWPAAAWLAGLPAAYTFILPLTYNRGRYVMPLIPLFIILGSWGAVEIYQQTRFQRLGRAVIALATALVVVFWANGARAYVLEVRAIESQHMTVARWLRRHTPPDAAIATQDIGVLAYFSERRLIDMAGLTDPAVVPIMHQPAQLAAYIREHQGRYVVVFPTYYPELIAGQQLRLVFASDRFDFHELGSDPLAVFQFPEEGSASGD